MAKIARVEVYFCNNLEKPTDQFCSFIEGALHIANNTTQKMVVVLDDGTEIVFDEPQFIGPTEVTVNRRLETTAKQTTTTLPTWDQLEAEARVSAIEPAVEALLTKCIKAIRQGLRTGKKITVELENGTPQIVREEVMYRLETEVHCSAKYVVGETDVRDNHVDPDWLELSPQKQL